VAGAVVLAVVANAVVDVGFDSAGAVAVVVADDEHDDNNAATTAAPQSRTIHLVIHRFRRRVEEISSNPVFSGTERVARA
jgi:hypothetical protein